MGTETTTRPPVWVRKFHAWANAQPLSEDGLVTLTPPSTTTGTPWSNQLPMLDQVKFQILNYDPKSRVLTVVIVGRKLGDTETIPLPDNKEFVADAWPERWQQEYLLDELPEGGKRFLSGFVSSGKKRRH